MFDKIKLYLTGGVLCLCLIASPLTSMPVFARQSYQLLNYVDMTKTHPDASSSVISSDGGYTLRLYSDAKGRRTKRNYFGFQFDLSAYAGEYITASYESVVNTTNTYLHRTFILTYKDSSGSSVSKECFNGTKKFTFQIPSDATNVNFIVCYADNKYQTIYCNAEYDVTYTGLMLQLGQEATAWEQYGVDIPDPEPEPEPEPEPKPDPDPDPTPNPDPETPSDALSMFTPLIAFVVGLIDLITANEYLLFFLCFILIGIGIGVLRKMSDSLR